MPHGAHHHPQQDRPGSPAAAPMSRETAEAILSRHGLDAAGLAPEELKRRWQDLARRHHPDLGGDMRAMQEINAASPRPRCPGSRLCGCYPRRSGRPGLPSMALMETALRIS